MILSHNNFVEIFFDFTDAFWVEIETNKNDNVTDNVTDNVPDKRRKLLLNLFKSNNKISTSELAMKLKVTKRTILRDIEKLKQQNKLKRIGSEKIGHWTIIQK